MLTGYVIDGIRELWRSAASFGNDWRRRKVTLEEIDALDPYDRERVLSDAGMTRMELALALSSPYASDDLLGQGITSLGVDGDAV